MRKTKAIYGASTILALFALACDSASTTGDGDDGDLSFAGFALTGDDDSDDGFDEDADTDPLYDETDPDAWDENGNDLPSANGGGDGPALPFADGDYVFRSVLVAWGQLKPNPEVEAWTEWNGRVVTDSGYIKVKRVLRFERQGFETADGDVIEADTLVRDEDPTAVTFVTNTYSHHDGLLLTLALPSDPGAIQGDLVFETEHFTRSVPLASLNAAAVRTFEADELGNELLIATHEPHRCGHGVVRMAWERKNDNGGVFAGKVFDERGELTGRLVGIWGTVEGKRRLKGRFETPDGESRGALIGTWRPILDEAGEKTGRGMFRALWRHRNGNEGVIGGVYQVGDEPGQGSAQGHWRAKCGDGGPMCSIADVSLPEDAAACSCEPDPENDSDDACGCDIPRPASACIPPERPDDAGPNGDDDGADGGPSSDGADGGPSSGGGPSGG